MHEPLIMGVINLTPDSFSDPLRLDTSEIALKHFDLLVEDGAHIIDIGAESSRPNALPLDLEEEWSRLSPTLKLLGKKHFPVKLSIDSYKPEIIFRAMEWVNIDYINDIKGSREYSDEQLEKICKQTNSSFIVMHMHKNPLYMQKKPLDGSDAVKKVESFFLSRKRRFTNLGWNDNRLIFDPGIGFGKTDSANLCLMAATRRWSEQWHLLLGISRKSWIGRCLNIENPLDRDPPSKLMELGLMISGAKIIRTHQVCNLAKLWHHIWGQNLSEGNTTTI